MGAFHQTDYEERVHVGAVFVYLNLIALRAGCQYTHDVESFCVGFGLMYDIQGIGGSLDYAFTNEESFDNGPNSVLDFIFMIPIIECIQN